MSRGAWLLAAAMALCGQEITPVFRAGTELVLVDVQVLHKGTRTPAGTLAAKDLRVFEDGVGQEIRQFSRDEMPLSVVLLFDRTPSVHGPLKRLAAGAKAALVHLKPQDEVAVMTYGESARLVDGFSTDRERNARAIGQAASSGAWEAAYFNEAVYQAALQLRQSNPASRRAIIWLTDNEPNVPYHAEHPVHTESEALRILHEDGVAVAPIVLKDLKWGPIFVMVGLVEGRHAKAYPPGDAKKYAEWTGGEAMGLRGGKPDVRLAELIDQLRARYTVGYRPGHQKAAGTFCKLRVELAPEGELRAKEWTVEARAGYYRK